MDTFRVQLPHPHPVTNEEEFITNSGRKIKRPIVDVTPEPELQSAHSKDMDESGISVTSATLGDSLVVRDENLSSSVQAELHLSLDRLSENYDPDEFKRLQEKSKNSRLLLTERERDKMQSTGREDNERQDHAKVHDRNHSPFPPLKDSIDTKESQQSLIQHPLELKNSEELIVSEEDEEYIVTDSLNYSSSREGTTQQHSERRHPVSGFSLNNNPPANDKYANLRYNPNWRETDVKKPKPSPIVVDFGAAPRLEDGLEQTVNSDHSGGEILVHKKELFSPVIPEWGEEKMSFFNGRSVSPTRLSADPQKLLQANAKYEEEFNRMLKAEVLNEGNESLTSEEHMQYPDPSTFPKKEGHSVLIRKLDSQDKSKRTSLSGFQPESHLRTGGYQLLPDRHRIPSSNWDQSNEEMMSPSFQQRASKQSKVPGKHETQPEVYYTGKKDPLLALSPREKKRNPLAPTPPKIPKPKNVDYVELNKLRVGRKTNSAGYLDLHKKRSRKVDQGKSRSQSELRSPAMQTKYGSEMPSPDSGLSLGAVEGLWEKQAERLKVAKGANVNKGKIMKPSQNSWRNELPPGGQTVLVSPKQPIEFWNGSYMQSPADDRQAIENQQQKSRGQVQSQKDAFQGRHHLPIPSRQAPQPSPRMPLSHVPVNQDELMNSLNQSGFRRAYFSPRMNHAVEESPLMKAYHSKYLTDTHEPTIFANRDDVLRQNFTEQNLSLPPQDIVTGTAEIWTNVDSENDLPPTHSTPFNHSQSRPNRKVTFLGENEPIAIEGISNGDPVPTLPPGAAYRLNRYKIPLPPTPPSKSQRHALSRRHSQSEGKENEEYYDVREDNFPVLPPILKSHHKTSPHKHSPNDEKEGSPVSPGKGSYLEQHEKQKRKFQYKIYTLDDYKNLKKDVKLGGLGPDLESARKKMEKTERAKKYAELIRREHKSNTIGIKAKEQLVDAIEIPYFDDTYRFTTNMDEKQRQEMLEKRNRALEYSKKVPKPKQKPAPSQEHIEENSRLSDITMNKSPYGGSVEPEGVDFNWGLLQMLKDRHEKEKEQVAAFSGGGS